MNIKKYICIRRGMEHEHHCEDFAIMLKKNDWHIAAVSDGCSSGRDSHFAAVLACKLLRKCVVECHWEETLDSAAVGKILLCAWIDALRASAKALLLDENELLATFLLLIYDTQQDEARIWVLGDGFVGIDDNIKEIDHNNVPDYPAYHLNDSAEELDDYLSKQTFFIPKPHKILISTDGAASFQSNGKELTAAEGQQFALNYLLNDKRFEGNPNMFGRLINILFSQYGVANQDDIGIVKFLFRREESPQLAGA